jgi:UDP-N-acetylglucosamine--N-acetylmuramyl-(pentapeptide) pyrophosphoryl-undecaprenol N-acetylglucosamine transferase
MGAAGSLQGVSSPRPLRALFLANDGLGAGHLVRTLAIARALVAVGEAEGSAAHTLLATTAEADPLFFGRPSVATLRLPTQAGARAAGWTDAERRYVVEQVLLGAAEGFSPDVLVVDTFPSGPHAEAAHLLREVPLRVLVRRTVRPEKRRARALSEGLDLYDLVVVPDDPSPLPPEALGARSVRVPPVTLGEASAGLSRAEARRALGLPRTGRCALVGVGAGGDEDAAEAALRVVELLHQAAPSYLAVVAESPLSAAGALGQARSVRVAPLQRYLAAFDVAVAAAGYNTAHELAKAAVPTVLYAQDRPFDDQAARAKRFADAGLAVELGEMTADGLREALAKARALKPQPPAAGGAEAAARAIWSLAMKSAAR